MLVPRSKGSEQLIIFQGLALSKTDDFPTQFPGGSAILQGFQAQIGVDSGFSPTVGAGNTTRHSR